MTSKEKLYKEWIMIHNKVCELTGNKPIAECTETFLSSQTFRNDAKSRSKDSWMESIQYQKYLYEEAVRKAKIENFFSTDEGKKLKESVEKRKKEIFNARMSYMQEAEKEIEGEIKSWLGSKWGVILYDNNMEVGIIKEYRHDDKRPVFHFGLTFSILFDTKNRRGELSDIDDIDIRMNYPTIGSFNLFETDGLCNQYLRGMGSFASDTERLGRLKKRLFNYVATMNEFFNERCALEDKLTSPFNYLKDAG